LHLNALPACSPEELVLCLSEILQQADTKLIGSSGSQDTETFRSLELDSNTVAALAANPVTLKLLLYEVVAMLPERYAFSLRFWDLLLRAVRCDEGDEQAACKVNITLRSVRFMQTVARKLHLGVSGKFRDTALVHSPQLTPEDHAKLVKWVASAAASPGPVPYVPEGFPSRLALLKALKAVDRTFVGDRTLQFITPPTVCISWLGNCRVSPARTEFEKADG
jgi:hypothetical protein